MHDDLVLELGGERGTRHVGAVEAALSRIEEGPFEEGDLVERAALLLRGIIEDHPFVDGNKRTGLAGAHSFLRMNGFALAGSQDEKVAFVLSVARGELSLSDIAEWLRARLERI